MAQPHLHGGWLGVVSSLSQVITSVVWFWSASLCCRRNSSCSRCNNSSHGLPTANGEEVRVCFQFSHCPGRAPRCRGLTVLKPSAGSRPSCCSSCSRLLDVSLSLLHVAFHFYFTSDKLRSSMYLGCGRFAIFYRLLRDEDFWATNSSTVVVRYGRG